MEGYCLIDILKIHSECTSCHDLNTLTETAHYNTIRKKNTIGQPKYFKSGRLSRSVYAPYRNTVKYL